MVDDVGFAAVLRLVEKYGGSRIYVPRHMDDGHSLVGALGRDLTRWLSERWGNDVLPVPRAATALRRARNREICRCYDGGVSVNKLALRFTLTERHVWRILGDPQGVMNAGADHGRARQLILDLADD